MSFSKLDEVRSTARARAVEDLAYFVGHVLDAPLRVSTCVDVQRRIEQGEDLPTVIAGAGGTQRDRERLREAVLLWLGVREGSVSPTCTPSETFAWIFAEELRAA